MDDEHDELIISLELNDDTIKRLKARLARLASRAKTGNDFDRLKSETIRLESRIKTLEGQRSLVMGKNASLRADIALLTSDCADLKSELDQARSEAKFLREDCAKLGSDNAHLRKVVYASAFDSVGLTGDRLTTTYLEHGLDRPHDLEGACGPRSRDSSPVDGGKLVSSNEQGASDGHHIQVCNTLCSSFRYFYRINPVDVFFLRRLPFP